LKGPVIVLKYPVSGDESSLTDTSCELLHSLCYLISVNILVMELCRGQSLKADCHISQKIKDP